MYKELAHARAIHFSIQSLFTSGLGPQTKARGFSKPVDELIHDEAKPVATGRRSVAAPRAPRGSLPPVEPAPAPAPASAPAGSASYAFEDVPSHTGRRGSNSGIASLSGTATPFMPFGRPFTARTNHLGQPTQTSSTRHVKYGRSYTMLFNKATKEDHSALSRWQLIQQATKVVDFTCAGLSLIHI